MPSLISALAARAPPYAGGAQPAQPRPGDSPHVVYNISANPTAALTRCFTAGGHRSRCLFPRRRRGPRRHGPRGQLVRQPLEDHRQGYFSLLRAAPTPAHTRRPGGSPTLTLTLIPAYLTMVGGQRFVRTVLTVPMIDGSAMRDDAAACLTKVACCCVG